MKIIVTGMSGTVAPVLAQRLREDGHSVTAWNRREVPPDSRAAVDDYIQRICPDAVCHLATGSVEWAEAIAQSVARAGARLLYTSSVSVFAMQQGGPFGIMAEPQPADDYGRYKLAGEDRIRAANPGAVIARIGWQIGDAAGSNNMVDYLTRTNAAQGEINASEEWLPACSFLADTAVALVTVLTDPCARGIYHFDGNPGLSFCEIATRLNELQGRKWTVRRTTEPVWDQRMFDDRVWVRPITQRL